MLVNQNSWAKVTKIKYDEKKKQLNVQIYTSFLIESIGCEFSFRQCVMLRDVIVVVGPFFLRQFEDGWWFILKCFLSSRNGILNIVTGNREETSDRRWTQFFYNGIVIEKKKHLGKDHSVIILIERFSRKFLDI